MGCSHITVGVFEIRPSPSPQPDLKFEIRPRTDLKQLNPVQLCLIPTHNSMLQTSVKLNNKHRQLLWSLAHKIRYHQQLNKENCVHVQTYRLSMDK